MEHKYYFGRDFIHSSQKAWNRMLQTHPQESALKPSIDFLCKLYKASELSAKLYYGYIDDKVYSGEMENLFPNNKIIDAYNNWSNGKITLTEYTDIVEAEIAGK